MNRAGLHDQGEWRLVDGIQPEPLNVEFSGALDARYVHEPNWHRVGNGHDETLRAGVPTVKRLGETAETVHIAPP